jgi:hypothetical protein
MLGGCCWSGSDRFRHRHESQCPKRRETNGTCEHSHGGGPRAECTGNRRRVVVTRRPSRAKTPAKRRRLLQPLRLPRRPHRRSRRPCLRRRRSDVHEITDGAQDPLATLVNWYVSTQHRDTRPPAARSPLSATTCAAGTTASAPPTAGTSSGTWRISSAPRWRRGRTPPGDRRAQHARRVQRARTRDRRRGGFGREPARRARGPSGRTCTHGLYGDVARTGAPTSAPKRPRMPFPGHAHHREPAWRRAPRRSPRPILGTCSAP